MPSIPTTCPYCGVGCGLIAEPQGDTFAVRPDRDHPANLGRICTKGATLGETLGLQGRILAPLVRGQETGWDAALEEVAGSFSRIIAEHGPDAVAFYVSGQLLTEDYYVANKLMKGFIGSGNIDTNSRLCMASAVAAHKRAFGEDIVPGNYADIEQSDLTILVGSNMAWTHPVLYQRLAASKEKNPHKRVVVIDPRRTASCDIADLHLALKPGTDGYLYNGLLNFLRRENAFDWDYLEHHTHGFAATLKAAQESSGTLPQVAQDCGLDAAQVAQFYRWFAQTAKTTTLFSQGINQSSSGVDKGNAIINVHLATGRVGKPGASPFSLTGQPNAMGGREVGGLANTLAAHMDFAPENCAMVGEFWQTSRIATQPGYKAVDMFEAIADGRIKAVWIMGTNPVVSLPNSGHIRAALKKCSCVIVSDCARYTDTTAYAHVLLPAAAWGEKSGTVTNSERCISRQRAFLPTPGLAQPDWWIITQVAHKLGYAKSFDYTSSAQIFREHAALSAYHNHGQRIFDIGAYADISDQQYEALTPMQWPLPVNVHRGTARLFAHGGFATANHKAQWTPIIPRAPHVAANTTYPFMLNTGRVRDQWHTMTRTAKVPRLLQHISEPLLYMQPLDAQRLGMINGDIARVTSAHGFALARVEFSHDIGAGQLFMPMHWNAQFAVNGSVNAMVASTVDPISGQPEFKATAVHVRPFNAAWYAVLFTTVPIDTVMPEYCVRVPESSVTRYEMADTKTALDWHTWFEQLIKDSDEIIKYADQRLGIVRMGSVRAGQLQAVLFVSPKPVIVDRAWLAALFVTPMLATHDRSAILSGRPPVGRVEGGAMVCICMGVQRNTIERAIHAQGVTNLQELQTLTTAGTCCGACVPQLQAILTQNMLRAG
ncbi:MAG: molybdopterin-dependent oxidoreductase [Pseudomonadota bacterium]